MNPDLDLFFRLFCYAMLIAPVLLLIASILDKDRWY
jgi:hypothetical protein